MSFIDKDQRITPWQTKNKRNFIENLSNLFFPVFFFCHLDLTCFVQWRKSLALTSRPYIRRLFLFSLQPRSVIISILQNWSELAFVSGFNVTFGPTCLALFCSHRPELVELLMLRKPTKSSCFLEDVRVIILKMSCIFAWVIIKLNQGLFNCGFASRYLRDNLGKKLGGPGSEILCIFRLLHANKGCANRRRLHARIVLNTLTSVSLKFITLDWIYCFTFSPKPKDKSMRRHVPSLFP